MTKIMKTNDESPGTIGTYKIAHPLYEDIVFANVDTAAVVAERLARFLVRNTDACEVQIEVLKYCEDDETGDLEMVTQWWWAKTVRAKITSGQ